MHLPAALFAATTLMVAGSPPVGTPPDPSSGGPGKPAAPARASRPPLTPPADIAPAVAANNTFAADIFRGVAKTPGNVAVSPWNIGTALEMARAGARGPTHAGITKSLRQDSKLANPQANADALRSEVLAGTGPKSAFKLVESNRLWINPKLSTLDSYRATLAARFNADDKPLDFSDPSSAASAINAWVATSTNNLITELIDAGSLASDTSSVITSAVYFNAQWDEPFDIADTKPQKFFLSPEKSIEHPLMERTDWTLYAEIPGATISTLNYKAENNAYPARAMFILPAPGKMDEVIAGLDIAAARAALRKELVQLHLPRFDLATNAPLKPALSAMGMASSFDPATADFSLRTNDRPNHVTDIVHAVRIKMDETRTEAAAATGMPTAGSPGPAEPPKIYEVRLDRPFIVVITHEPTGAVLFVARVNDPRK